MGELIKLTEREVKPRPLSEQPMQHLAASVSIGVTCLEAQKLCEHYRAEHEPARCIRAAEIVGELHILKKKLEALEGLISKYGATLDNGKRLPESNPYLQALAAIAKAKGAPS